ncbi:MAG: class I tRNA ligase family protein [Acidobacteriota bacterium]
MTKRILVTSALPYANGPVHFGHLVGAYLPADIFVRYHRMIGSDVLYICGTDEHGVAITVNAERAGKGYQEYVDHWHREIGSFFARFGISFDHFGQTSRRDPHYALSQEVFLRLLANERIAPRDEEQHFCVACRRFLPDRYVEGTCYLCGASRARGDECKACGAWLDAVRLREPRCAVCGAPPELRTTTQWELLLEGFPKSTGAPPDALPGGGALQRWFDRFATRENLKPHVYANVVTKLIENEGQRARPITRDIAWGVPLPARDLAGRHLPGSGTKVLYVWFDAPVGYISATIEWARGRGAPESWRDWWIERDGEDGRTRLVHFIGKDNIPFHTIVFPAMLAWQDATDSTLAELAATTGQVIGPRRGERFVLPDNVPANEFYNLEGRKFNTSDGWYVDLDDFAARYDPDVARYALTRTMPEAADSDFSWKEFQARTNELANVFGNLALRVLKFTQATFDGRVPGGDGGGLPEDEVRAQVAATGKAIDGYRFRDAAEHALEVCRIGNRYFDARAPWAQKRTDLVACGATIRACLALLEVVSGVLSPFIPATASRLRAMLGLEGNPAWPDGVRLPNAGRPLGTIGPLVAKIEDAQAAREIEALSRRRGPDA